jgi:hypothetical protein
LVDDDDNDNEYEYGGADFSTSTATTASQASDSLERVESAKRKRRSAVASRSANTAAGGGFADDDDDDAEYEYGGTAFSPEREDRITALLADSGLLAELSYDNHPRYAPPAPAPDETAPPLQWQAQADAWRRCSVRGVFAGAVWHPLATAFVVASVALPSRRRTLAGARHTHRHITQRIRVRSRPLPPVTPWQLLAEQPASIVVGLWEVALGERQPQVLELGFP